jgi:hypothetical protein
MSKLESLENRLRELTAEFGRLLRAELAKVAAGGSSVYLTRKVSLVFEGRSYSADATDKLERLEAEVRSLSSKLVDQESEQVLGILSNYSQQVSEASDLFDGGRVRIARQLLIAMGDKWHAT